LRPANLRRAYFDCRYGQLHVRTAFPAGGGFDERATVVVLHDAGVNSGALLPWLRELGQERSVYAPDFPGHGESDGPDGVAGDAAFEVAAAAVLDLCADLRLRAIDLVAVGTAGEVARRVANARVGLVARVVEVQNGATVSAVRAQLDGPA
jgi:pimeloyl-ACP methyl ester carboxylesterase